MVQVTAAGRRVPGRRAEVTMTERKRAWDFAGGRLRERGAVRRFLPKGFIPPPREAAAGGRAALAFTKLLPGSQLGAVTSQKRVSSCPPQPAAPSTGSTRPRGRPRARVCRRRPWNPVPCRPPLRRCFGITGAEASIVENGFLIPHPHSSRLNDDQEAEVAANILIQPFF